MSLRGFRPRWSLRFTFSLSFEGAALRSSPNSLLTSAALSFKCLRKSANLGFAPNEIILPAHSVHLTLINSGSFLFSSLNVFVWFKSLTYSGPMPDSVLLATSKWRANSSKLAPSACFKGGRSSNFLICALAMM